MAIPNFKLKGHFKAIYTIHNVFFQQNKHLLLNKLVCRSKDEQFGFLLEQFNLVRFSCHDSEFSSDSSNFKRVYLTFCGPQNNGESMNVKSTLPVHCQMTWLLLRRHTCSGTGAWTSGFGSILPGDPSPPSQIQSPSL